LRELPALFSRTDERIHIVEMGEREPHERRGVPGAIQEQRYQRSSVLHEVRQPHLSRSSNARFDVRIGALRNFPFKPKVHLNYAETVLPMKDGLPKLKDFPASIGGSGDIIPE
jgi:hypothetical protein